MAAPGLRAEVGAAVWQAVCRTVEGRNAYRRSERWREFRELVLAERCSCARCGVGAEAELHVHHLTLDSYGRETRADVEVVCAGCHGREHGDWNGWWRGGG